VQGLRVPGWLLPPLNLPVPAACARADCIALPPLTKFMLTHAPRTGAHYGEVFEAVAIHQQRPPIPPGMPPDYAGLMAACWGADPLARPTFEKVQAGLADMLRALPDRHERFVSDL
jgi:hypothetical protein